MRLVLQCARCAELMSWERGAAVDVRGKSEDLQLIITSPTDLLKASHICRVYYCSREHQRQHWKTGGHRKVCKGSIGKDVVDIEAKGNVQVFSQRCQVWIYAPVYLLNQKVLM